MVEACAWPQDHLGVLRRDAEGLKQGRRGVAQCVHLDSADAVIVADPVKGAVEVAWLDEPPPVQFRYLTVHPEAIYLKAHPADVLYPLRLKMHNAVASVLGPERSTEAAPDRAMFLPHVSIGYINRDGKTEPVAAALESITTRPVNVTFTKADLLEFHRDHRMYEWTSSSTSVAAQAGFDLAE